MQTFLPFADFRRTARVLDDRRLGKQRVETLQILRALHIEDYGWASHPAVTMWRGHTAALVCYGVTVVEEWTRRGHDDTTIDSIAEFVHPDRPRTQAELDAAGLLPPWSAVRAVHLSHRSALVRKDPDRYAHHFPGTPANLDYVWPPPAAPPSPRGRRDAWVVRGPRTRDAVRIPVRDGEVPWLPPEARNGRLTKRQRQVDRLVDAMAPGDVLAVPDGAVLHVGEITGDYRHVRGHHRRPVRWRGRLARGELRFPAALQDPQDVFALYDEPLLRAGVG